MAGPCQLDANQMDAALRRLAGEIAEKLRGEPVVVLGIRSRGLPLAERIGAALPASFHPAGGRAVPVGALDITLYRDDISQRAGSPIVRPTEIPFSLKDKTVVLVDDVLYTGRTIRAALDALLDHGRPNKVLLAVLVDRGGRELPIQGDFVGLPLAVGANQRVSVKVKELDGEDGVYLEEKK
ncbi:MAG TPA: bifunctional pyr operon transcriptional regulator/uracil phosphoribosyltransferase PyrR [Holophagaceae bacterium]|nr:bifunctional pyr operon transcriptional regulator/uracil phosphoribosyltransferase PyrR [Holophagaceae bacterium]